MVMVVANPIITRDKGKMIYQESEIDNTLLNSIVMHIYQLFRFFNGNCEDLQKDDPQKLRDAFSEFMPLFFDDFEFSKLDIFSTLKGISFLPVNRNVYLRVQCFINSAEESFSSIKYSCFLYGNSLVWSGLGLEDQRTLYSLLYRFTHIQNNVFKNKKKQQKNEHGFQQLFENRNTILENKYLQRVYLSEDNEETYMVCCDRGNVRCIFFVDSKAIATKNFCQELGDFIVPQMDWLGNVLREPAVKSKTETPYNYIYFNNTNLAMKSSIQSDELPRHVMSTIQTMHQDFERNVDDIFEVIMKNAEDTWVVGKRADQRELFVYFNLHRVTLLDISEETRKLSSNQLGNIFIE